MNSNEQKNKQVYKKIQGINGNFIKLKRKPKGILRVVFSRAAVIALLVLLQAYVLFATFYWLAEYSTFLNIFFIAIGAITVIYILNEETNSSFKMVWMIPVLVFPVFGALFFIFVNLQVETKFMRRRLNLIESEISSHLVQEKAVQLQTAKDNPDSGEAGLITYLNKIGGFPTYADNGVKFFPLGEDKFAQMLIELEKAEKFIFMEYFIVREGYMWDSIFDILKKKVEDGVEVRFMYDGMCSLSLLPYGYYKDVEKFGIHSRAFSQIKPVFSTYQNNRDHRKILVIDGKVAFTGGINLADEYINLEERFGHWKDTAVMVQGRAVKSFTMMFLKMWHVAGKKSSIPQEELYKYVDAVKFAHKEDIDRSDKKIYWGGNVTPYGDNPFSRDRIGRQVYIDILNRAKKYVHIMTPYLILDDEMMSALRYCAQRGVDTVIIMPHIPDKKYAFLLAHSYYKELLKNGVKIYEYTPGFIHAKIFVSDDIRASVGTINLDFRSLYLHFECAAYIYRNEAIMDIEKDFQSTKECCQEITAKVVDGYSLAHRMTGHILRIISPLM